MCYCWKNNKQAIYAYKFRFHVTQCKHTHTHNLVAEPVLVGTWFGVAVVHRHSLSQNQQHSLKEKEREKGNKEWLPVIIRPHMPEKGLISQEMRKNDRDKRERGTERKSITEAEREGENTRELQPSSLGNWDGLRWSNCSVWVFIFRDTMFCSTVSSLPP